MTAFFIKLFIILSIVFFIGLIIYGILQPRGYLKPINFIPKYEKPLKFKYGAFMFRHYYRDGPHIETYGKMHWNQSQGSERISNNGYFTGPSLTAFKKADETYKEKETE